MGGTRPRSSPAHAAPLIGSVGSFRDDLRSTVRRLEFRVGILQGYIVTVVGMARYDVIARAYAARPDDYSVPATVSLLDLLGRVNGQRMLDLACGHGPISRQLARLGAEVVGIDLSADLIAAAREREVAEPLGITYVHGDASDPGLLQGASFDAVVCNFGLSDIDDLKGTLANVVRIMRAGARFVFCILHPCFPGAPGVSGSWPPHARYYDEGWWLAEGELSAIRNKVGANHRTIATYCNGLIDSGLVIDRIAEPPPEDDWARNQPGAHSVPVYLSMRAVKLG
jgi:SAM-dependent methyltransferase